MHLVLPPIATEILAGYIGGSAKTLAFYPLDTMTTLREVRAKQRWGVGQLHRYYAGCGLTLLGAAPYALIFHAAFWLCETVLADAGLPLAALKFWASICGAIAAAAVGVPFEVLKHRMQIGAEAYRTPMRALTKTMSESGIRGLYVGLGSTLARNVPYNALHFGLFELIVQRLRRRFAAALSPDGCNLLAGALAGALTALLTTPMDLVNTRLQTQALEGSSLSNLREGGLVVASNFSGPMDAAVRIVREEGGPPALWRGAGLRVAQFGPSACVFFFVYSFVKRVFG